MLLLLTTNHFVFRHLFFKTSATSMHLLAPSSPTGIQGEKEVVLKQTNDWQSLLRTDPLTCVSLILPARIILATAVVIELLKKPTRFLFTCVYY